MGLPHFFRSFWWSVSRYPKSSGVLGGSSARQRRICRNSLLEMRIRLQGFKWAGQCWMSHHALIVPHLPEFDSGKIYWTFVFCRFSNSFQFIHWTPGFACLRGKNRMPDVWLSQNTTPQGALEIPCVTHAHTTKPVRDWPQFLDPPV